MSEKPEWFELAGEDQKPELPVAKSKTLFLKIAIFTAPLVLVGGAMVFADGEGGDDDRPNIDTTITSTNTGSAIASAATASDQTTSGNSVANPAPATPATPATKKGVGVAAPGTNMGPGDGDGDHQGFFGGDDDDEGREHEGREGGEREHHERGEHEGRSGTAPVIPKAGTTTTKN